MSEEVTLLGPDEHQSSKHPDDLGDLQESSTLRINFKHIWRGYKYKNI